MKKPQVVVHEPQAAEEPKGLYQSENFTTVGAAWNKVDKNGRHFIGAKLNIQGLTFADNSFILYPPFEEEQR
jgi:uncharacterized protein (DUF736 family)